MTSELKPCPFCGSEPTVRRSLVEYNADAKHPAGEYEEGISISCHACGFEMCDEYREDVSKRWNTRAAPEVPELGRYDLACDFDGKKHPEIIEVELGDFVRYDQAAKVVAKLTKDANHQCRERVKEFERAEAAEAKYTELESAWLNAEGKITELEAELKRYKEGEQCTN